MRRAHLALLDRPAVRSALKQAWQDSHPGTMGGHEEGGFIVRDAAGDIDIVRWPSGEQNSIALASHLNCGMGGGDIIATFHTHPNTGGDHLQEPSETDKRAVRDDPDLKGEFYEGEFVVSYENIYLISPDGQVSTIGDRLEILAQSVSAGG